MYITIVNVVTLSVWALCMSYSLPVPGTDRYYPLSYEEGWDISVTPWYWAVRQKLPTWCFLALYCWLTVGWCLELCITEGRLHQINILNKSFAVVFMLYLRCISVLAMMKVVLNFSVEEVRLAALLCNNVGLHVRERIYHKIESAHVTNYLKRCKIDVYQCWEVALSFSINVRQCIIPEN